MKFKLLYLCSASLLLFLMKARSIKADCTLPQFQSRNVILPVFYPSHPVFSERDSLTYVCMIGHKPIDSRASRKIICSGNRWNDLELNCERKSCGSPPDFDNGKYEETGFLFGDTITPVCKKGYKLAGFGSQTRVCRDKGWDGRDPLCEVVKCEAPPPIENGQFKDKLLPIYDYLQVVTYRCNRGLSLIGSSSLHCSEDGTFKPDPPKCVDGCPRPEIPNADRIGGKAPPYKLGNFIDYKCEDGYSMMGNHHIVCTEGGWSPKPPQCIEDCRVPVFGGNVVLTKEYHSKNSFPHGSSVTFECKNGYEPVDPTVSKSVTCEETKWTSLSLTCKSQAPPVIENGQIEAVLYKCDAGFLLSGSSLQLSKDGTFIQDPPKCVADSGDRMCHGRQKG